MKTLQTLYRELIAESRDETKDIIKDLVVFKILVSSINAIQIGETEGLPSTAQQFFTLAEKTFKIKLDKLRVPSNASKFIDGELTKYGNRLSYPISLFAVRLDNELQKLENSGVKGMKPLKNALEQFVYTSKVIYD